MSEELKELIINSASTSCQAVVALALAGLQSNDLSAQESHDSLIRSSKKLKEIALNSSGILSAPLWGSSFIIDNMALKKGEAYTFFFDPSQFSVQGLLAVAENGFQAINYTVQAGLADRSELTRFYDSVREYLLHCVSVVPEKKPLFAAVAAILEDAAKF